MEVSSIEMWLYGGIVGIFAVLFLALICAIIFRITGNKIRKQLKQEYGEPQYYNRQ